MPGMLCNKIIGGGFLKTFTQKIQVCLPPPEELYESGHIMGNKIGINGSIAFHKPRHIESFPDRRKVFQPTSVQVPGPDELYRIIP